MSNLPAYLADLRERARLTAVRTNLSHPLPPTQAQRPRACRCFYCNPQLYTHDRPQPYIRPSRHCKYEATFVLQPNSHEPLALSYLAVNWFQPADHSYTREQETAITECHSLWRTNLSSLHLPFNPARQLSLLRRAYKIFNTIFFCRKLPSVYIDRSSPSLPADASPWMARTDNACVCWTALRENLGGTGHGRAFLWVASALKEVSQGLLGMRVGWVLSVREPGIFDARDRRY